MWELTTFSENLLGKMAFYPFPVHYGETGQSTILRGLLWPDELNILSFMC